MKQVEGGAIATNFENNPTNNTTKNNGSDALGDTSKNNTFYVPPYLLSLSDEYLRFEDCSTDGSITRDRVNEGALQIRDKLQAMEKNIEDFNDIDDVTIPEVVTKFCHENHPNVDLGGVLCQKDSIMKDPYLLSTFGWSVCEEHEDDDEEETNCRMVVKCNMCQARAICRTGQPSVSNEEDEGRSRKKRRRITQEAANLKLIDSHRTHCPYVSGFSNGYGKYSELPGWKVVISKLLESAETWVPARAK